MHDSLTQQILTHSPMLRRRLKRAFPSATEEDVEDAVAEAYAALYERYRQRETLGGGLLYVVAWRQLRGLFRRKRPMYLEGLGETVLARDPPQDVVCSASNWLRGFEEVIQEFGAKNPDALRRGLLLKMDSGRPDTALAEEVGIRRERLNMAWRALMNRLLLD